METNKAKTVGRSTWGCKWRSSVSLQLIVGPNLIATMLKKISGQRFRPYTVIGIWGSASRERDVLLFPVKPLGGGGGGLGCVVVASRGLMSDSPWFAPRVNWVEAGLFWRWSSLIIEQCMLFPKCWSAGEDVCTRVRPSTEPARAKICTFTALVWLGTGTQTTFFCYFKMLENPFNKLFFFRSLLPGNATEAWERRSALTNRNLREIRDMIRILF